MNIFERTYLDIIFESDYSDENWIKHGSYRSIDFYIRKDGHLLKRLLQRYPDSNEKSRFSVNKIIIILQKFIKKELKDSSSFLSRKSVSGQSISFTVHAIDSDVYVSGRFKNNAGVWRCYIATVLPPEDAHHSSNDYFKEIDG